MTPGLVRIERLKTLAVEAFPAGHALRELLLRLPDEIPAAELAVLAQEWLTLLTVLEDQERRPSTRSER